MPFYLYNPGIQGPQPLVVWGGEWEVQEGLGRASKPSPTLLAPAERVTCWNLLQLSQITSKNHPASGDIAIMISEKHSEDTDTSVALCDEGN